MAQVVQLGLVRAAPLSVLQEEEKQQAQATQAEPMISALAGHVRQAWTIARQAKLQTVEPRMLAALRARHGQYDPEKLQAIRDQQGGSEVYANLTSVKCRAAASWIKDVMLGGGSEKPWAIQPTPVPDLPPQANEILVEGVAQQIQLAEMSGQPISDEQIIEMMQSLKAQALEKAREFARNASELMEAKMEDQLQEGGFVTALSEFVDDIVTFPTAIMKGPIVRRKPRMKWQPAPGGQFIPQVADELVVEFERVSPFNIYPSPGSSGVDDGFMIERLRYLPEQLDAMIGVDGYDSASIKLVLEEFGQGGLREWLTNDVAVADAEGKSTTGVSMNPDHRIDALQYWGVVMGKTLIDYGMSEGVEIDPVKPYHCEIQIIGHYVIKAVLNYDPLHRKPYSIASYEEVPGSFWGNSVADLVHDVQTVVNASARAIVNNMAMASGPQVAVNVDMLPAGEEVSQLIPWKIWQTKNDTSGQNRKPIEFFQPESFVGELLQVFTAFSTLADEYSGVPKYMSGDARGGGAGRTASGLSMLMDNAGKALKQVVANIDHGVLKTMLARLYDHNMRYSTDPDLKGDATIVARGASALVAKDTAAVRRNEFLAATANPVDMQIVGIEGRAALLREQAKTLDMDADKVVPPLDVLRQRLAAAAIMATQGQAPGAPQGGTPPAGGPSPSGQTLSDGRPVTDNFSPPGG